LHLEEVEDLQKLTSYDKGIGFDGLSDIWFRKTKKTTHLSNWWNDEIVKKLEKQTF
jgi:hypothetical protein